jgi:hypothetical protein
VDLTGGRLSDSAALSGQRPARCADHGLSGAHPPGPRWSDNLTVIETIVLGRNAITDVQAHRSGGALWGRTNVHDIDRDISLQMVYNKQTKHWHGMWITCCNDWL